MARYRVGVIGCGAHGTSVHLPAYKELGDEVEIVAVCDRDQARADAAAAKFGVKHVYTAHTALLAMNQLDIVSICTPPVAHMEQTIDAFAAGCHVICEKPLAMNADEVRAMLSAAKRYEKKLTMGLQSRFHPSTHYLRQYLAGGKLGHLYFARIWTGHIMRFPGWAVFHKKSLSGGGVIAATAVHILDRALWVFGNPKPLTASAITYAKMPRMRDPFVEWKGTIADNDVEDFASGLVRCEGEFAFSLEANWFLHPTNRPNGVEILGDYGTANLEPLRIELDRATEVLPQETPQFADGFENGFIPIIRDLFDAIENDREPLIKADEMLQVQQVIDALYHSAEERHEVAVV